jgi:pyridoxamine 5'-phosphate oxidase family protein
LSKIKTEGLTTIWFATGNSSAKTKDFRSNPKAGICFYKEGNSVAMTGEVEVVSDTGTKKELWQDWFIHHFPKGPEDPEYILLKFRGNHATIWIDGQFVHRKV